MSAYPIVIRKITMKHRTHEKDYHQVLIVTDDERCLVVNRWGKRGQKGQMEFHRFSNPKLAVEALNAKRSTKERGGYVYDQRADLSKDADDEDAFRKALGLIYWTGMKSELEWLVPGIDTAGAKDPDLPTWEEGADGKMVHKGYQPKHKFVEAEPTVEQKVAENENWGAW
ncbi:WGR domain-containing protein [Methylobacterium sp. WL103]|uniref:WGR domain-containing protein n=1 Tax=Methylobacterium sp. WL103 TaxID=2603891 RepID=UPI0011C770FD|nr:WGR domain-containing protein [Methylobacterium sp. WL103]TXN07935.1 WGR domain-containing protein [Methylobacterium sp. WL103]